MHIDIDPRRSTKTKRPHIPIVSDLKYALAELNKIVEPPRRPGGLACADRCLEKARSVQLRPDVPRHPAAARHRRTVAADADRDTIITRRRRPAPDVGRPVLQVHLPRRWLSSSGLGTMGFGLPAAIGAKAAHPDKLVVDIDGDGSFLMNIQELATCICEKIPVKVLLLNNQHLGMVVQWEDRFHASNRAHTYLGPIDDPEATGQGDGLGPQIRYPDFVADRPRLWLRWPLREGESRTGRRLERDDRIRRALRAGRASPLPRARAADDPLGQDGEGPDQGITASADVDRQIVRNRRSNFGFFEPLTLPSPVRERGLRRSYSSSVR